jgi:SufS family cysteine desulfurase
MLAKKTRKDFPIFENQNELIYLDNAATTQKPLSVIASMSHYYSNFNANVGRGVYSISMKSYEAYEKARETMRQFVNATAPNNIIFTKGTTESVNYVAQAFAKKLLSKGDEIVVTGMEHHSNLIPWQAICKEKGATMRIVHTGKDGRISLDEFKAALGPKTKIVSAAHVSNVLGVVNPVKEMIKIAHEKNIPVVLDGAQAIAHTKVDVQELDVDFYCFSAHKMYGPMGIGILYAKDKHFESMEPFQTGGGIAHGVNYASVTHYMPPPFRFEAGTPNVAGALGMAAAAEYISDIGYVAIQEHENMMFSHAINKLEKINGIELYGSKDHPTSIISFNIKNIHPYDVGNHLNKFNIAVRTGVHCAIPFVDSMGLLGTVRASFGIYNSEDEIDVLIDALGSVIPMDWTRDRPNSRFMF